MDWRGWDMIVDDKTNVTFINTHPKGISRTDNFELIMLLYFLSDLVFSPCMIIFRIYALSLKKLCTQLCISLCCDIDNECQFQGDAAGFHSDSLISAYHP